MDKVQVRKDFAQAVNMRAAEIRDWLDTKESKAVGFKGKDGSARESVGHASGRPRRVGATADELDHDPVKDPCDDNGRPSCEP
jgi:Protein of unknown function (DUF3140)